MGPTLSLCIEINTPDIHKHRTNLANPKALLNITFEKVSACDSLLNHCWRPRCPVWIITSCILSVIKMHEILHRLSVVLGFGCSRLLRSAVPMQKVQSIVFTTAYTAQEQKLLS